MQEWYFPIITRTHISKIQQSNDDEKESLATFHGYLTQVDVSSCSDAEGEEVSKDGSQQDENDHSGITASSSSRTKENHKKDVGHIPFRRLKNAKQRYQTHVKLSNFVLGDPITPFPPEAHASDAQFEEPNNANHEPTILSGRATFLVHHYPRVPPKSPSSVGSSDSQCQSDTPKNFPPLAEVNKEFANGESAHVSQPLLESRADIHRKALPGEPVIEEKLKSDEQPKQGASCRSHIGHSVTVLKVDAPPFIPLMDVSSDKEKTP